MMNAEKYFHRWEQAGNLAGAQTVVPDPQPRARGRGYSVMRLGADCVLYELEEPPPSPESPAENLVSKKF